MAQVTHSPTLVSLNRVSFQFADGELLFDALDLNIDRTHTAIVGRNGVGKSMLASLIASRVQPTAATVERYCSVAYVNQIAHSADGETVAEHSGLAPTLKAQARINAGTADAKDFEFIGDDWDLATFFRSELVVAGMPDLRDDDSTDQLSGGQRARIALAGALLSKADLLILDEPTNHLDLESAMAFEQALQTFPGAIIAASHDEDFISALCPTRNLRWSMQGWRFENVEATSSC